MRKREKQIATEGKAPRIDMETLRASARAAEHDKANSSRGGPRAQPQPQQVLAQIETPASGEGSGVAPGQHGAFQVANLPGVNGHNSGGASGHGGHHELPPPPWGGGAQSYVRSPR